MAAIAEVIPGRRRALEALAGLGCLVAAAALGAALHGTRGEVSFDRVAAHVIGPPSPVPGPVAVGLARLADRGPTALLLVVIAAAAAVLHRRVRPALATLAAGAVTQGLVLVGKRRVQRTLFGDGATFPSGHVAGATAVLVLAVLVAGHRGRRVAGVVGLCAGLLPVGAALGAIWTQSHVWSDVVGGALVGAGVPLVLWAIAVSVEPSPARLDTRSDPDNRPVRGSSAPEAGQKAR
ncbi:MAG: phosphatase PAP2 family protein [Acidimicrobiales bacterium]